jgi:hypothetical protein
MDYCSDKMDKVNKIVRTQMKMFSCPFASYCGTDDLATLVPEYDGTPKKVMVRSNTIHPKTGGLINFHWRMFCRYEVSWPMDSKYGDKMRFRVKWL